MKMEQIQPKNSLQNTEGPKKSGPLRRFRTPKSAPGKPNLEAFYFLGAGSRKSVNFPTVNYFNIVESK